MNTKYTVNQAIDNVKQYWYNEFRVASDCTYCTFISASGYNHPHKLVGIIKAAINREDKPHEWKV
jgi:hypothetical protein